MKKSTCPVYAKIDVKVEGQGIIDTREFYPFCFVSFLIPVVSPAAFFGSLISIGGIEEKHLLVSLPT